jgi:hypothetical protein
MGRSNKDVYFGFVRIQENGSLSVQRICTYNFNSDSHLIREAALKLKKEPILQHPIKFGLRKTIYAGNSL